MTQHYNKTNNTKKSSHSRFKTFLYSNDYSGSNLPSTSSHSNGQNQSTKSATEEDDLSESTSTLSSSTDLSSRAFPKKAEIKPSELLTCKIKLRKSRWEPLTKEEERERLKPLFKSNKKVKIKTKYSNKNNCTLDRKHLVDEFHREKDHFRPLTSFLKNRKRLAEEILDSIDLETRYEIFPELQDKSDDEVHDLIFTFLKGMSQRRILAVMKGNDLSESSSTEIDEDDCCEIDDKMEFGSETPKLRKKKHVRSQPINYCNDFEKEISGPRETKKARLTMKKNILAGNRDQLEGEIRSDSDLNEGDSLILFEDKEINNEEECKLKFMNCTALNYENEEEELRKLLLTKLLQKRLKREEDDNKLREYKNMENRGNEIKSVSTVNEEPSFIISLNCMPSSMVPSKRKIEYKNIEQKVICVLPSSSTLSTSLQEIDEGEDEKEIVVIEIKQDVGIDDIEKTSAKLDNNNQRKSNNGSDDDEQFRNGSGMICDENSTISTIETGELCNTQEDNFALNEIEEPDIELVDE